MFMFFHHHIPVFSPEKPILIYIFLLFFGYSCILTGVYSSCQTMVEMLEEYKQLLDHSSNIRGFSFPFGIIY